MNILKAFFISAFLTRGNHMVKIKNVSSNMRKDLFFFAIEF